MSRRRKIAVAPTAALLALWAACAAGSVPTTGRPTPSQTHEQSNVVVQLRLSLLSAKAEMDGVPVVDLVRTGWCTGTIVTRTGAHAMHWSDLGNLAQRLTPTREWFRIPAADGTHVVSYPRGRPATRIDVGFGMLDEECAVPTRRDLHGLRPEPTTPTERRPRKDA